eukprot:CAMPEP_0113613948 /NCGR_PEP_ID=MMETSP0017_2-20120614/6908_1 /TAXON_ID=2856 /ORGANISM="Cylindrotheca closterium" /LENGTH=252 /DNA_ID=CAMNT_0000523089 /DNA_START=13 /DNA_END=771 /DNA_ORIENTATION=- /assembly_acc=CAM_ASM_000147
MNTNETRVHFLPEHDTMLEINSLEDYTEQEILDSWYTETELAKIAVRSYKEAHRFESGKTSKSDSFHRGLEAITNKGEELSTTAISRCTDAVMDEQDAQWEVEIDDYDRLAVVSEEVSRFSVAVALEKARADEQEAQRIYKRMEKKQVKTSKRQSPTVSKPMEGDDHTSICSDLSHPETDSADSSESSSETIENSLDFEQVHIPTATEQQQQQNKKRTESISRRVKALKIPKLTRRAPETGVSNALMKTICT